MTQEKQEMYAADAADARDARPKRKHKSGVYFDLEFEDSYSVVPELGAGGVPDDSGYL